MKTQRWVQLDKAFFNRNIFILGSSQHYFSQLRHQSGYSSYCLKMISYIYTWLNIYLLPPSGHYSPKSLSRAHISTVTIILMAYCKARLRLQQFLSPNWLWNLVASHTRRTFTNCLLSNLKTWFEKNVGYYTLQDIILRLSCQSKHLTWSHAEGDVMDNEINIEMNLFFSEGEVQL